MPQPCRCTRLAQKTKPRRFITEILFADDLQCNRASEVDVERLVCHPHRTAKWRLIDELWSDLAQEVERGGVDENTLALLNQRFEEYAQDPGQAQPLDACLARLAERKRQWK